MKEVFYLTTHSTHLVTVIWRRTFYERQVEILPKHDKSLTAIHVQISPGVV